MLTGFQLKASIGALNLRITELSKLIEVNRFTITKLVKTPLTEYIQCHTKTLLSLEGFFKENNILFLDNFSVTLNIEKPTLPTKKLTVFQLRAARASLDLTLVEFGKLVNFAPSTLSTLEQGAIMDYAKTNFIDTDVLKQFFIEKSLSFPDDFTIRVDK